MKGKKKILVLLIIFIFLGIGLFCLYEFILNPLDEIGYRCQTPYNQSKYRFVTGGEIDILKNSCFVADCCMHTASFRTKMSYEELKIKAQELEKQIKEKYPDKNAKVNIKDGKFFRTYSIFYEK